MKNKDLENNNIELTNKQLELTKGKENLEAAIEQV